MAGPGPSEVAELAVGRVAPYQPDNVCARLSSASPQAAGPSHKDRIRQIIATLEAKLNIDKTEKGEDAPQASNMLS